MKKCGTCFRCIEDWKDAERLGLPERKGDTSPFRLYSLRPRRGVALRAIGVSCPRPTLPDHPACDEHQYRWAWNLREFWIFGVCWVTRRAFTMLVRYPLGGFRKPAHVKWEDYFNGCTDTIIPNSVPKCPHCGEMPYSVRRCVFCGQRFLKDEKSLEYEQQTTCCGCGRYGEVSEETQKTIDELFAEEFGEEKKS